jgi:hypothetical protein
MADSSRPPILGGSAIELRIPDESVTFAGDDAEGGGLAAWRSGSRRDGYIHYR